MTKRAFAREADAHAAYSTAKAAWWGATRGAGRLLVRPAERSAKAEFQPRTPAPDASLLRSRYLEAFAKDRADIADGLYPLTEAAVDPRVGLRRAVDVLSDARAVQARRERGAAVEARDEAGSEAYPNYYRQNFHFQSGGWFTAESAARYEAQVEALFAGAAGAMRRRALSLLAKAWRDRDQRGAVLVDLACGSGAFLTDLKGAFPRSTVIGLDLSPAYLAEARSRSGAPGVQANMERLPFADASLDGASCIYLFHELPPRVRPVIAREIARVLKPGGVLAFADSLQESDEPRLARLLEAFPAFFHEPFYESYQATDLAALFADAGLALEAHDDAFLTKAMLFRKPA